MKSPRVDLIDLFDEAWERLRQRLDGLTDDEWSWHPTADERIGIRWRLDHIRGFLVESRNWSWLGTPSPAIVDATPGSAEEAIEAMADTFAQWHRLLVSTPDDDLAAPIGSPAGDYGDASRYSFALHLVDELIHHAAEVALLRDLYAGRETPSSTFTAVLVYDDIAAAHDSLVATFGFEPGTVESDATGRVIHGEVGIGGDTIWLHRVTHEHAMDSVRGRGTATGQLVVFVDDVDAHYERSRAAGARVGHPPADMPYGQREYSAFDLEDRPWVFATRTTINPG